jgi:14-3-3 protein epsilon
MVAEMKKIIADPTLKGNDLRNETRNLISVGYKNVMSARRASWRQIEALLNPDPNSPHQGSPPSERQKEMLVQYRDTITTELQSIITEIEQNVVKVFTEGDRAATQGDILVFFHKLNGDYNRYGAEASHGETREVFKNKAKEAYQQAQSLCATASEADNLAETSPIRLGLALNYSVFNYEIAENKSEARELAQAAFDNAIDKLDTLTDEEYRDSTLIMQLLKDNLSLWGDDD